MPRRREVLATNEIYHVFNRGVEKRTIFENRQEYLRFLLLLQFYQRIHRHQFSRLTHRARLDVIHKQEGIPRVEIICYCLMPNHFHLLIKQLTDNGVSHFLKTVSDGYAKYFNKVHQRVGPLFQGKFKAVRIEDGSQLLHVSRYIHLNPFVSSLTKTPGEYPWSSYREYVGDMVGFCSKGIVLDQFKSISKYRQFVENHADYAKKLHRIEHIAIDLYN
ncbi:transposase [Candidatus Berkelbacteria bacterium]|nr:transposase [Candidatus Berkelbacteria bacterium]